MDAKRAQEIFALTTRITELEQDAKELRLVLDTLNDVEPERKCFRMVGGVLIERTVAEVSKALDQQSENIKLAVQQLESNKNKLINEA